MKFRFFPLLAAPFVFSACSQSATTSAESTSAEPPIAQTSDAKFTLPVGFEIQVFADKLKNPRKLIIGPNATATKFDVFVSESRANRVRMLRESNGDGKADSSPIFVSDLNQPYGLAFWKNWLYVANTDAIVRFPYKTGATSANTKAEKIANLTEGGYNQHWTRNLLFSRDNKKLFVTVGSSCNTCEESDSQRAAISVLDPDGKNKKVFASGLRNPVGMAWQPDTNQLWTVVNERDNVGDNAPPDYLTSVSEGEFYGWPYAYTDIKGKIIADLAFGDKNRAMVKKTVAADVPVQAHSAALGLTFYPTQNGNFPDEYKGDAFLAYHGSWNRSQKTGYKIARVNFQDGKPTEVTDFVSGFLSNDGSVSGRPVDIVVAPDGSLLFSDDEGGKIWRVSYKGTN
jgi:glucose/arabinose dehydrogenase